MGFDEYLELGNKLEQENKVIMACAAYIEALKNAPQEHSRAIENYIKMLSEKISNDDLERNQELYHQMWEWKLQGKLYCALRCFEHVWNYMNGVNWIDSDNALLYHCLDICQLEEKYSVCSLDIKNTEMEEWKNWYYSLKNMVRRVDTELYDDKEIVEYIRKENISVVAIYFMCENACFQTARAHKNFAKMFQKYGMVDYATFYEKQCLEEKKEENAYKENKSEVNESNVDESNVDESNADESNVDEIETNKRKENEENQSKANKNEDKEFYPDLCENKGAKEKIAFIIPVNDEELYQEALYYIGHLKVPENMEVEVIPIRGAVSATSAYNKGMKQTNAKYKVYMHQDAMVINPNMIYEILDIFQNKEIGMIGVAGAAKMPESGVWWEASERYMRVYHDWLIKKHLSDTNNFDADYIEVEAIDGVMMITQYDITWREDIFTGWHFYDVSQSMEFQKAKRKIVVAAQKEIWCIHVRKSNKDFWYDYDIEKEKFLKEYKKEGFKHE